MDVLKTFRNSVFTLTFAAILSSVYWQCIYKPQRLYEKKETMLRHLKRESFLTKKSPLWMLEQIEEDFENIHQVPIDSVDEAFMQLEQFSPQIVRYRIIDNELYRYFSLKNLVIGVLILLIRSKTSLLKKYFSQTSRPTIS